MADFSKLTADLEALSTKVDALIAAATPPVPEPVIDDQPAVDAASATVEAILAKIP